MALSGMTGFARVEGAAGAWIWAVEARSVNGRINRDSRWKRQSVAPTDPGKALQTECCHETLRLAAAVHQH